MTQQEFNTFVEDKLNVCIKILESKGHDYSVEGDRLSNFKQIAKEINVDPIVVWWVYFHKHYDALKNYVDRRSLKSETLEGRFTDAINYLLLGEALIEDIRNDESAPGFAYKAPPDSNPIIRGPGNATDLEGEAKRKERLQNLQKKIL